MDDGAEGEDERGGELAAPPAAVAELIDALAAYVQRAVGLGVDGTPETLPVVDHYITLVRTELRQRSEIAGLVGPAIGAYFGELWRRQIGGFWQLGSGDYGEWRVCSHEVLVAVNPVGIAFEVLLRGEVGAWPAAEVELRSEDRARIAPRLAALPPVSEDEYYLLSTRFEVLEIIVEALAAQRSPGAGTLTWEDYERSALGG